jgi:sulfhydrogenase subunit alpha
MPRTITVDHLPRVEGHGRIIVELEGNTLKHARFNLAEGPRFFEALAKGRDFSDVPMMVSRICSICSVGHKLTSILAMENALGVKVTRQTELLRDLLFQGMSIESHVLHTYFLALPDFLGAGSAIELASKLPNEVKLALSMKKLGNTIQELVGGRAIHPINPIIGGFGRIPTGDELAAIRKTLVELMPGAEKTVALFGTLKYPSYTEAPTVFVSLVPDGDEFSFFGRRIATSKGAVIPVEEYKKIADERVVPHSSAKHSLPGDEPFMTGSLARVNLFFDKLTPKAKAAAQAAGIKMPSNNSLHNNHCQAIENLYSFERAIKVIDLLLKDGLSPEAPVAVKPKAGRGVAATEVPRGTLYHEYELDAKGAVVYANVITPTAQNQANIEKDFKAYITRNPGADDKAIAFNLEMITRAYDPCISCAAHYVEIRRT